MRCMSVNGCRAGPPGSPEGAGGLPPRAAARLSVAERAFVSVPLRETEAKAPAPRALPKRLTESQMETTVLSHSNAYSAVSPLRFTELRPKRGLCPHKKRRYGFPHISVSDGMRYYLYSSTSFVRRSYFALALASALLNSSSALSGKDCIRRAYRTSPSMNSR